MLVKYDQRQEEQPPPGHRYRDQFESFEFLPYVVTPAKAGVQKVSKRLDTGFRRYDDLPNFKGNSKLSYYVPLFPL